MDTARVCNTEDLRTLAKRADENDYNRRVTEEFVESLDPEGNHLVIMRIGFMGNGYLHRCQVLAKFTDREDPVTVDLDVAAEDFNSLVGAREFMAQHL